MTRKRILIVEDEAIVAEDIKLRLQTLGYEVVGIADTAEAALKQLDNASADVVLLDQVLKGKITGKDIVRRIEDNYKLPVVFVTAFTEINVDVKKENAISYVISKPYSEDALKDTIERALRKAR